MKWQNQRLVIKFNLYKIAWRWEHNFVWVKLIWLQLILILVMCNVCSCYVLAFTDKLICRPVYFSLIQGTFWVWGQPVKGSFTLQRRLSLAEPIPRMIPGDHPEFHVMKAINFSYAIDFAFSIFPCIMWTIEPSSFSEYHYFISIFCCPLCCALVPGKY